MKRHVPAENTPRVVALTLAFFGALAAVAAIDGVFAKFDREEVAALAAFAAAFALLTYFADLQVRALVDRALAGLRTRFSRPGRTRGRQGGARVT